MRRCGIVVGDKRNCKALLLAAADSLDVVSHLSDKSKMGSAMKKIRHSLLQRLPEKPLYFYGHRDRSCPHHIFSNFAPVAIVVGRDELIGVVRACLPHIPEFEEFAEGHETLSFHSSEQIFMMLKALAMLDGDAAVKIIECRTALQAKKLGREVSPWRQGVWNDVSFGCMLTSVRLKFRSGSNRETLLRTGARVLVEASPSDRKWGIGIGISKAESGALWRGQNLLGAALCVLRRELRAELSQ